SRPSESPPTAPATPAGAPDGGGEPAPPAPARIRWWLLAALSLVAVYGGFGLWLRRRARASARRSYLALRGALSGAGLAVPESLAPLALARLVERRVPVAARAANRVIACYVREAFAGRAPTVAELGHLRVALVEVERALRAARRELRADANATAGS
ncbi:MAG TPA: hypothetical protein VLA66_08580, partial [Thermoanaerobaculia bacterium]|nr:hypothetical protein [Thermoanaerobaculia bacterium]